MTTPTLLGKAELLAWAADVTGITPCEKYGDLKDGLVFLSLARELFPPDIDSAIVRLQRRGARDPAKNWSLLTSCLRRHRIPLHLCNRQAVERGHTRHCFNLLVLFYFLLRLAHGDQFSVDFAQPVDPQLAAFLQSPDSVFAVDRTTGTGASAATAWEAGAANSEKEQVEEERERGRGASSSDRAVTRLSSPPSVSALSPYTQRPLRATFNPGVTSSQTDMEYTRHNSRLGFHERSPAETASSSSRDPFGLHAHRMLTSGLTYPHDRDPRAKNMTGNGSHEWRVAPHRDFPQSRSYVTRKDDENNELVVDAASRAPPLFSSPSSSLLMENRLLREELQYMKAVSQLLITQQRGLEAAAEMRAAATLQGELAKTQLSHLHDLRQLEVTFNASSSPPSMLNSHHEEPQLVALEHRVEVAEKTAAHLYERLQESHRTYDATLQQLQQAFRSIDSIAEAARPAASSPPSAHSCAAAYEEAVMDAMMAQLECVPAVLLDAFRAQWRALLLALSTLRVSNERLRMDAEGKTDFSKMRGSAAFGASGEKTVSFAASSFSPQSAHSPGIASLCEEARYVCQTADPTVQHACHGLVQMVEWLQGRLEDAQHDAEKWQSRCRQIEEIPVSAEFARQQAHTTHAAQNGQDLDDRFTVLHSQGDATHSISPQRQEQAEAALLESQRLYDRVAEVLVRTFSTPGTEDMKWANQQLVSLLDVFVQQKQQNTAIETVLAGQCESIASLREELRRRIETLNRATADLAKSELQRGELEQRCALLENQLHSQKETHCAEKRDAGVQGGNKHHAWLAHTSLSVTSAQLPMAPFSSSAKHTRADSPPAARIHNPITPLPESNVSTVRLTSAPLVSSSYQPGAFRSPSPSSSEDERQQRDRPSNLGHRSDKDYRGDALQTPPLLSSRSRRTTPTALEAPHRRQMSYAEDVTSLPEAVTPISTTAAAKTPDLAAVAAAPSPLLSAAELERRKQEILRRYNVE